MQSASELGEPTLGVLADGPLPSAVHHGADSAVIAWPIGEDPDSSNPVQRTLNERIAELSGIIRETAASNQPTYIPLFETFHDQIVATPGKALTEFRFLPIYLDTIRFYVLRRSSDEIAQANGWRFHVDGVHLNQRGGMIFANLVQEFLDS